MSGHITSATLVMLTAVALISIVCNGWQLACGRRFTGTFAKIAPAARRATRPPDPL
jgi:hypothetical protein